MKKSLICLATMALLVTACKKDESTPPAPVIAPKYLQSTVNADGDSTAIEYNVDKYIYRMLTFDESGGPHVLQPDYRGGKQLFTISSASNLDLTDVYVHQTFTYNADGTKPTLINFFNSDNTYDHIDSLVYNANGKLNFIYYYRYDAVANNKVSLRRYEYIWDAANKNITRQYITYFTNDHPADAEMVTVYTYDDKVNPAPKVTDYYIVNFEEEQIAGLLSANNVLTSVTDGEAEPYTASTNNTYTYDEDGYPVVMTLRSTRQDDGAAAKTDSVMLRAHYGK